MTDQTPDGNAPALDAALAYANEGLRVLPTYWPDPNEPGGCGCGKASCSSPGKHPLTKKGVKDATADLDQIRKWWETWPDANVAVEPGEDQFVVDVDPRNGGDDSLTELEEEYGPFRTKKVRTGSGGFHIWFKTQTPVRGRSGLRPGIDIKTAGGYVLMPPSRHVQGSYRLDNGSVAAPAPPGLIDLIGSARERAEAGGLSPEQLSNYSAPGETSEERLRWTQSALDAIPNEGEFDDRGKWVGIAHAIRTSCGIGLEDEAYELFDDFSSRWKGGVYVPIETNRVWDSLPGSSAGGYEVLLTLAGERGYTLPLDHPWHATNMFEADITMVGTEETHTSVSPTGLDAVLNQIERLGPKSLGGALDVIEGVQATCADLPRPQRALAQATLFYKLTKLFGREGAREVLRSLSQSDECSAFARDPSGLPLLQQLTAADVGLENRYLVHKRIPTGGVGALSSDFSLGKSWLVIDLGCSVAFERRWLGCETTTTSCDLPGRRGQPGVP